MAQFEKHKIVCLGEGRNGKILVFGGNDFTLDAISITIRDAA